MYLKFLKEIKGNLETKNIDTIEDFYQKSIKEVETIHQELKKIDSADCDINNLSKSLIIINNNLQNIKHTFFKKCLFIENMDESKKALSLYRDFLQQYNIVLTYRDEKVKTIFGGEIAEITDEIIAIKKQLLPINNSNIELHSKHHLHNKEYYTKIEKLEEKRINLLKNNQMKKDNKE